MKNKKQRDLIAWSAFERYGVSLLAYTGRTAGHLRPLNLRDRKGKLLTQGIPDDYILVPDKDKGYRFVEK